ncbi:MAG: hypothetical protein J07HQX50_01530 [Haloquadratum sp. J07HQX50]|nr:MAG: hypothetical protein J07HQX50_01530 [Haloquadratum sp. J07HQX50]
MSRSRVTDDRDENEMTLRLELNVTGASAVTSTGSFIGSADYLNHKRDQSEQRRAQLQQTATRSAHLPIQSIAGFPTWRRTSCTIERTTFAEAHDADVDGVLFENLTHARTLQMALSFSSGPTRHLLNSWSTRFHLAVCEVHKSGAHEPAMLALWFYSRRQP